MKWLKRLFCSHKTSTKLCSWVTIDHDDWGNADRYLLTEYECNNCGQKVISSEHIEHLHSYTGDF